MYMHACTYACMYVCMYAGMHCLEVCMYVLEGEEAPESAAHLYYILLYYNYFTRHTVCMYYWRYVVVLEVGMQVCIGGSGGTRKCLQI